jgi:carbon storage regulator
MLVLLRNVKQTIKIGNDIEVKILWVKGSVVRVGIDAPKTVHIHRKEVYERMNKWSEHKKITFKK